MEQPDIPCNEKYKIEPKLKLLVFSKLTLSVCVTEQKFFLVKVLI